MSNEVAVTPLTEVVLVSNEQLQEPAFREWLASKVTEEGKVKVLMNLDEETAYKMWVLTKLVPMEKTNVGVMKAIIERAYQSVMDG